VSRPALLGRAKDRGEDVLGLRAVRRAIARTAGLPGDDGGPQGVLGARAWRRAWGRREAEDVLAFGPPMGGKATGVGEPAGPPVEHGAEPIDVVAARHRETMVRDLTGALPIPRGKGRCSSTCTCGPRSRAVLTELCDLPRLIIDDLPGGGRRRVFRAPRRGTLMRISGSSTREKRLGASVPPCVVIGRRADQRRADPLNN
jgi:hypothetical protein